MNVPEDCKILPKIAKDWVDSWRLQKIIKDQQRMPKIVKYSQISTKITEDG